MKPEVGGRLGGDRAAIALLILIPVLLFADVIFFRNTFFFRDLSYFYHPTKRVLRDIVLSGEIPYWNPAHSGGQPLAANPDHETFYPLQALILLPSYELGYRLHIVVHIPLALLGMYLLLRSIRLQRAAAMFGALAFGLSGFFLSYVNLLPILFTLTWLPWVLLFFRRFLIAPSARSFAFAAAFLGLLLLASEPTTVIQTGLLMAGYAAYRAAGDDRGRLGRRIAVRFAQTAAVIAVAVGMASVQILPTLDLARDTARLAGGIDFDLASTWSMPPVKLGELIAPDLLGSRRESGLFLWTHGPYGGRTPFLLSIYVGLFPAVLALAGAFHERRGRAALLFVIVLGFVVAAGSHTPALRLLYDAGLFTMFRYPEKFALMGLFALIVFAAMTFDRIAAGDRALARSSLLVAAAVAILAGVLWALTMGAGYPRAFVRFWDIPPEGPVLMMVDISRKGWLMVAVRASVVSALLLIAVRQSPLQRWWYGLALLFTLYDLGTHSNDVAERVPGTILSPPPVASALPPNRSEYRLLHETQIDIQRGRILPWAGNVSYFFARNALLSRTPSAWGFRTVLDGDYDLTNLAPTRELFAALLQTRNLGFGETPEVYRAISNVGFVARLKEGAPFGYLRPVEHQVPVSIDRARQYPRYYFADQMVLIRNLEDFVDKTVRRPWSSRVAFVEFSPFRPGVGRVLHIEERSNATDLDVVADGTAYLVISITPHRYWRATIDGRDAKLIRTNVGYQGLVVPRGQHRVELRYRNPWVIAGSAISFITILGLAFASLFRGKAVATG